MTQRERGTKKKKSRDIYEFIYRRVVVECTHHHRDRAAPSRSPLTTDTTQSLLKKEKRRRMSLDVPIHLIDWQYKDSRAGWTSFPQDVNRSIEDAYRAQKKNITISFGYHRRYHIDFSRWELVNSNTYGRRTEIQRVVKLTEEQKRAKENVRLKDLFLSKRRKDVEIIFKKYANAAYEIDIDGVGAFLEEIDIDAMDVDMLVFCWLCDAKRQATFTFDEFALGLAKLECSKLENFKSILRKKSASVLSTSKILEDIYMYAFSYAKEGSSVPMESATAYWELIFSSAKMVLVEDFVEFLSDESCASKYDIPDTISQDGWRQMLYFFRELKSDLTGYDEASSPSLADSFVEYVKLRRRTLLASTSGIAGGSSATTGKAEEDDMDW